MNKKWWIIIATSVVLIAVGIVGWRSIAAGKAEAQAPQGETAVVRRGALQVAVDATGSLAPHSWLVWAASVVPWDRPIRPFAFSWEGTVTLATFRSRPSRVRSPFS